MNANASFFGSVQATEYHADFAHWSQSMLNCFRQRRRLAEARFITGTAPAFDPSDEMERGTVAHAAILEPSRLAETYAVYPPGVLAKNGAASTNLARDFKADHEARGQIVMKAEEFAGVERMAAIVRKVCGQWLELPCKREHVIHWQHPETGLPLKMRADWIIEREDTVFVFDLKTTKDASPRGFRKSVENYGYWLQDAQYREGVGAATGKPVQFYFVAVESDFPHMCVLHSLDIMSQTSAAIKRADTLRDLADCIHRNDFSEPFENKVNLISCRQWAFETDGEAA